MTSKVNSLYRHRKTGGVYRVLQEWALLESDLTPCVVYQNIDDDNIWVRSHKDFFDGRFEEVEN